MYILKASTDNCGTNVMIIPTVSVPTITAFLKIGEEMKLVSQDTNASCGMACVAMICDKNIDEVKKKYKDKNIRQKNGYSTRIGHLEKLLGLCGIKTEKFENWNKLISIK